MQKVTVTAEHSYDVLIDIPWSKALVSELSSYSRAAVIVSKNMRSRIAELPSMECEVHYFEIPDGEEGKSSKTLLKVWDWLGAAGFTRSDVIVGIGGGSTTDFAGYAAASWLRGLDWIAIPTTLAGMVDAAIGGKTAINSDYGKNLIGAFHSPKQVIIDLEWLSTLTDRDYSAGLAEVVKTGFISDPRIIQILDGRSILDIRSDHLVVNELITRSVEVKARVVSEDFKESFAREALNYGHTLGHAIELDSKFSLRHGECVSIGMVFIASLQKRLGTMSEDIYQEHLRILTNLGLPIKYSLSAWPKLMATMSLDKKSRGKAIRFVTLDGIGKTSRLENPDEALLAEIYAEVSS
jgi:3-dehydroquinate synthase